MVDEEQELVVIAKLFTCINTTLKTIKIKQTAANLLKTDRIGTLKLSLPQQQRFEIVYRQHFY